jgi:hypothetical protein
MSLFVTGDLISCPRIGRHYSLDIENDHLEIVYCGMEVDSGKGARQPFDPSEDP